jgi:uncharacterized membrane-anchored protein YhcB (DUF1043 family)
VTMAISEITALALVVAVAIGAFLSWLTHRDIGNLARQIGGVVTRMDARDAEIVDAVTSMRSAAASCERAARSAEANTALMREWFTRDRGPPGAPAE